MVEQAAMLAEGGAIYCPRCDYDLRGVEVDACPECGKAIDHAALQRSRISWLYRKEIGRFRAFWKTVWRVTFRTRELTYEMARPVDLSEAKQFRAMVWRSAFVWPVLIAAILVLGAIAAGFVHERDATVWLIGVAAVGIAWAVFGFTVTGVQSYWFHPRAEPIERQNRAVALSYYASAPWAAVPLLGLVGILGGAAILVGEAWRVDALWMAGGAVLSAAALGVAALPFLACRVAVAMAGASLLRGSRSMLAMGLALPAAMVGLLGWWFALLPGLVLWIFVMLRTW